MISPQGSTSIGNIRLSIGDGTHDALTQYLWNGASFQIYLGAEHFEFSTYRLVVSGTVKSYRYTRQELTLSAQGKESLLDNPIQSESFEGTGALEGPVELRGVKKPIAYGNIFNCTPVLVDPDRYIYYLQNGDIPYTSPEAIAAMKVYDGGVELTRQGVTGAILTTPATPGYYYLQPVGDDTYIRLGAPPAKGTITIDYGGQAERDVAFGETFDNPILVLKDLFLYRTSLTEDDLDLASFNDTMDKANQPFTSYCGVYLQDESAIDSINYIMRSLNGAWTFTANGKLKIALFIRGSSVGEITENDIVEQTFTREDTTSFPKRVTVGYWRNLTMQTENDFSGAASTERRTLAAHEYRYTGSDLPEVIDLYPDAKSLNIDTCLSYQISGNSLVVRILQNIREYIYPGPPGAFYKPDVISFAAKRQQFKYEVGQTITINYDRFDYDDFGQKDMLIMSLEEDSSSNTTRFTCWG